MEKRDHRVVGAGGQVPEYRPNQRDGGGVRQDEQDPVFHSPGDLPDPGIKPTSLALGGGFFTTEPPGKPPKYSYKSTNTGEHSTKTEVTDLEPKSVSNNLKILYIDVCVKV